MSKPCSSAEPLDYIDGCLHTLRESGARVTAPRTAVIRCLANATHPLSARDILQRIEKSPGLTKIDQASVYRILDTLVELDLVHRVFPSGHFMACRHTECGGQLHLLVHCTVCNSSSELGVPEQLTAPLRWFLDSRLDFSPTEHLFQISGVCRYCKETPESAA